MKKFVALSGAAVLAAGLLTGCGGKDPVSASGSGEGKSSTEAGVQETDNKTTFTVGFDAEFPPYGYRDENGEYVGFDLDLAAEVCARYL